MKKISLIVSTVILAAALSGCGNEDKGSGTGHMYAAALSGNPQSLDPQFADDPPSNTVIKNLYSGLMKTDAGGNISCCNAESYTVSDDGTVYTFKLRDDNYWFFDTNDDDVIEDDEYFPVTADDYVFAIKRVLDPKMKSPYAQDFLCIKNAEMIARGLLEPSDAEVYAPDDKTLVVVLEAPDTEFLYLMTTPAAYPCNEEFFNSTKGRYGLDDRSVMSNGAFFVRQWFYDPYGSNNILYMKRNDADWSETYDIAPSFLSFSIEKDEEAIREAFKGEDAECFSTMSKTSYNSKKYLINSYSAQTLGLVFNPQDKYFSNPSLQKAVALSIDRGALAGGLNDDIQVAGGVIPPAVNLGGRSYRELVSDRSFCTYDRDAAAECFAQGKSELGVESIEGVKILVSGESSAATCLHTIAQSWQEIFGVYIGIDEVTKEEMTERMASGDYSIVLYPVTGETGYGASVIGRFENDPYLSYVLGEEKLTPQLRSCADASGLVEVYSAAERAIVDSCGFVPLFYRNSYLIAKRDNEGIQYDPFTEAIDYRLALNYD